MVNSLFVIITIIVTAIVFVRLVLRPPLFFNNIVKNFQLLNQNFYYKNIQSYNYYFVIECRYLSFFLIPKIVNYCFIGHSFYYFIIYNYPPLISLSYVVAYRAKILIVHPKLSPILYLNIVVKFISPNNPQSLFVKFSQS